MRGTPTSPIACATGVESGAELRLPAAVNLRRNRRICSSRRAKFGNEDTLACLIERWRKSFDGVKSPDGSAARRMPARYTGMMSVPQDRPLIPTTSKSKLYATHSHPVGAQDISDGLRDAPQFRLLRLHFMGCSSRSRKREPSLPHMIMRAEF